MEPLDHEPTALLLCGASAAVATLAQALWAARGARQVRIEGPRGAGHRAAARWLHRERSDEVGPWLELSALAPDAVTALFAAPPTASVCLRAVDCLERRDRERLAAEFLAGRSGPRLVSTVEFDPEPSRRRSVDDDLDYFLVGRTVVLPSMAERRDDLEALARAVVERAARELGQPAPRLAESTLAQLGERSWPGELAEFELTLRLATTRARGSRIEPADLGLEGPAAVLGRTLVEVEREHVRAVLEATGGNRAHAARALGINRSTLYNKLRAWSLA